MKKLRVETKQKHEIQVEEIPRSPLGPFQPSFVCTMTLGNKQTSFARGTCAKEPAPFDVDDTSLDNNYNTLIALDSHSKSLDMGRVQLALGGNSMNGDVSMKSMNRDVSMKNDRPGDDGTLEVGNSWCFCLGS